MGWVVVDNTMGIYGIFLRRFFYVFPTHAMFGYSNDAGRYAIKSQSLLLPHDKEYMHLEFILRFASTRILSPLISFCSL